MKISHRDEIQVKTWFSQILHLLHLLLLLKTWNSLTVALMNLKFCASKHFSIRSSIMLPLTFLLLKKWWLPIMTIHYNASHTYIHMYVKTGKPCKKWFAWKLDFLLESIILKLTSSIHAGHKEVTLENHSNNGLTILLSSKEVSLLPFPVNSYYLNYLQVC